MREQERKEEDQRAMKRLLLSAALRSYERGLRPSGKFRCERHPFYTFTLLEVHVSD